MGFMLSIGQGGTSPHLLVLQVPSGSPWQLFPVAETPATKLNPLSQCGSLCSAITSTSADVVPQDFSPVCRLDGTNPVQAIRKVVSLVETIPQGASVHVLHGSFLKCCGAGVKADNSTQIPLPWV